MFTVTVQIVTVLSVKVLSVKILIVCHNTHSYCHASPFCNIFFIFDYFKYSFRSVNDLTHFTELRHLITTIGAEHNKQTFKMIVNTTIFNTQKY